MSRGGLALGTAVRPPSTRGSVRVGVDVRTSSRLWEVQRGEVSAAQGPGKEGVEETQYPKEKKDGGPPPRFCSGAGVWVLVCACGRAARHWKRRPGTEGH